MKHLRNIACAAMIASLSAAASAQDADAAPPGPGGPPAPTVLGNLDALGSVIRGPLDVQTPSTHNRLLGTAYAWGSFWVSGGGSSAGPFFLHEFDGAGNLMTSSQQNVAGASTVWGHRDLEADECGNKLWGGWEGRQMAEYDFVGGANPLVHNSTHTIAGAVGATIRAIARDPSNGHFYTVDFSSGMTEFSINPVVIHNVTNNPLVATYGAGWDPVNSELWLFGQVGCGGGTGTTQGVTFAAANPATGVPTGATFCGMAMGVGTNIAGGASTYEDPANPGFLSIVGLHQSSPDSIVGYDLAIPFSTPPCGCASNIVISSADPNWHNNQPCLAKTTSNGCVPAIGSVGNPTKSGGAGTFDITLSSTRPNKAYIYFYSINTARNNIPFQGGSLCMSTPVRRTPIVFTTGATPCGGSTSRDFGAIMASAAFINAGDIIRGQWWGRDTPGNSSLSDAIEFDVCP